MLDVPWDSTLSAGDYRYLLFLLPQAEAICGPETSCMASVVT